MFGADFLAKALNFSVRCAFGFSRLYLSYKDITPNPSQCQNFTGKSKNMNHPQSTQITAIKGG